MSPHSALMAIGSVGAISSRFLFVDWLLCFWVALLILLVSILHLKTVHMQLVALSTQLLLVGLLCRCWVNHRYLRLARGPFSVLGIFSVGMFKCGGYLIRLCLVS